VQDSPVIKSKASGFPQFIKIGNLDVKLPCFNSEFPQIFVEFLRNLLMKFYRVRIKGVRLMKNMGKLNGFLFSSVLKVHFFPKVLILLRLPRLIPFLERLTGSGAWGAVHGVLI
jgi:hypothetical protein